MTPLTLREWAEKLDDQLSHAFDETPPGNHACITLWDDEAVALIAALREWQGLEDFCNGE